MRGHVLAVASALIERGVKSGDSVILLSENRLEWLYCDFGIQAAGAITVPIYPNTPPEVANTIAADSRAVMAIASNASMAAKITDEGRSLSWLPYAHVYGRINEIFVGLVYGGQTWISRGADHLAQELQEVKPTVMCSVPRVYEKMYAAVMARVQEAGAGRRAIF